MTNMEKPITLMKKGFNELQQNPMRNPSKSNKTNPSKASKAIRDFYAKKAEHRMADPFASDYTPQLDELQKTFCMRPGCPSYSHRATSTSHIETNFPKPAELPSNISTVSLSSQLSLDDWASVFQNPDLLESKSYVKFSPSEGTPTNASGLSKWRSYTEGCAPLVQMKSHTGDKAPWYVAVLREKDVSLQKLAEELARLASCEAECARKDDVISILREEVETMQKQLDQLQRGSINISKESQDGKRSQREFVVAETSNDWARKRGFSLPSQFEQKNIPEDFRQEVERLKSEFFHSNKILDSKMEVLNETLQKDQEELEQLEKEYTEIQQKGTLEYGEETLPESESKESKEGFETVEELEEELIVRKLFEFQRMNNELYDELEKVKNDYDMATGAISSLQRQLSFEGSQLRRAHAERELLQKELRERGDQLEAMSNKFCNLREERKHEEMMGSIERENYKLRQNVSDLECKLEDKSQLIDNLQSNVNRLQAELVVNQHHIGNQLTQQSELQKQLEVLQRVEQQTRVTLEAISARFERFRSKIIQATYSTPGTKSPQAEITDDEVLEALQKIIADRLDFHQLLKQKGVKVPSLISPESSTPTTHKKKSSSR
ncbi:coiled-coil domain-containing protein 27 [Sceloporus undulatus]|uniref:coiled-coil domain-containing protein 27 n=1 Tax=Sceloporus undulatus TaxID=8520 RepID=UPI001C4D1146|nr:coiled-coil domain-containing protein 27 [Sceloporus undulatus]XP_042333708.1 coiled-coil domain-containing protein 27 [Sceloporus undulatus]XP_042333709.1 coiled-coil domain-containing protein 27 [Sceloporus undulatus]XP_042333710.1 coiled-coil domain-containing protein 27 [Sceloporus undulatus]